MTKGSVLVYTGSVFHGGGANTSKTSRIRMNVGTRRLAAQEENQYLACPPEIARTLPEGLLRLIGYHRGSYALGYVDDLREPWTGCTAARRLYRTSTITAVRSQAAQGDRELRSAHGVLTRKHWLIKLSYGRNVRETSCRIGFVTS